VQCTDILFRTINLLGKTVLPSTSVFPCHYHFTIVYFTFTFLLGENASEDLLFKPQQFSFEYLRTFGQKKVQGGSNMTGTDLYVNKPHCAAAVRP